MGKLIVVVGGQFGSEGKGRVAADLAAREADPPLVVRVGGPNAGHCVVRDQLEWKLRQLPTASISRPNAHLAIGAGSEVDLEVLAREVMMVEEAFGKNYIMDRLWIDPEVTILTQKHKDTESSLKDSIGSTGSGVGAARSARLMREADRWADTGRLLNTWKCGNTALLAHNQLAAGGTVIVEGPQGFGLGLHAGYYPYCSSADFRAIDALAMAGISPWDPGVGSFQVWVVMRTHPIRVGGNSGPLTDETSWEDLRLPEERTTVTNKVRRVGYWDSDLAKRAIQANGTNVAVALTMADHHDPMIEGVTDWTIDIEHLVEQYERDLGGAKVWMVGTSKTTAAWRPTDDLGRTTRERLTPGTTN